MLDWDDFDRFFMFTLVILTLIGGFVNWLS